MNSTLDSPYLVKRRFWKFLSRNFVIQNNMKNKILILCIFLSFSTKMLNAGEGMWLPMLLSQLNEKEMRDMGMRITAEDIYSVNHSSLKDAIVLFGGGCTGELVSDKGLLLTNHHCGYGNIQRHSSLENDYLTNGFWAQRFEEELPNPGLSVTFLVRMEDVSVQSLKGVTELMTQKKRDSIIQFNINVLVKEAVKGTHYNAQVKPFYAGNQYYLFVTEIFTDVRLVGAPPSNIGKFGGDTDNWMWPRHTGDFSMFRIYADKDNKPAAYSKDNVPYRPAKHLTISLKGIKEGDFTFVYGFPGTTQQYLPSYAIDMTAFQDNPIAIGLRGQRLDIIDNAMEKDRLTRLQYSAKAAGIANYWKKMIGESRGIKRLDGIEKKKAFERSFQQWAESGKETRAQYGQLMPAFGKAYSSFVPVNNAYTYLTEGLLGIELVRFAWGYNNLVKQCRDKSKTDAEILKLIEQVKTSASAFHKNYNKNIDAQLFEALMGTYIKSCETNLQATVVSKTALKYKGNINTWATDLYKKTIFADSVKLKDFLTGFKRAEVKKIEIDPAYILASGIYAYLQNTLTPELIAFNVTNDSLQRLYMAAQMDMQPEKVFYPDANSTLRIAYGNVKGYSPADAVNYNWFTTLDGIMQKENPDIYDYVVEPKLKELYKLSDYGRYADADQSMHVAFIASNHTTGGNSGSPVLNADGQLIGINFDRCWEGTMSDLMYDPDQCRNISLDIRYCLFIIDKMAGAERLIEEMTIIQ